MSRSIAEKDVKLLWAFAMGRCSNVSCRRFLVEKGTLNDSAVVVGEMAHILPYAEHGPRGESNGSREELNEYANLILLCPTCHTLVDKQPETHGPDVLRRWKDEHEQWVFDRTKDEMPGVSFSALETVTQALLANAGPPSEDLHVLAPRAKMLRNSLHRVGPHIASGMLKASEVEAYIGHAQALDPDLPEKLKAGFVQRYNDLRDEGIDGDALFEEMMSFASGGSREFGRQAAGLAVLVYLFERCEVFEK